MRKEYDFSKAKKNPYIKQPKQQVTIKLDNNIVEYFKNMSEEVGIPYQSLINFYLADCVNNKKKLNIKWN